MGAAHDALVRRWYMEGRRRYRLRSVDALGYALNRLLLWRSDSPMWTYDVDEDGGLVVYLYDDAGCGEAPCHSADHVRVLDSVGGVDVEFSVSDHGNVLADGEDPVLIGLAADMVRNLRDRVPA